MDIRKEQRMATQYDGLASQYRKFQQVKSYRIIEYSFMRHLGQVSGHSILDLACGEGSWARRFKQMGANRVVGVDISEEMLNLALNEETRSPLGIEYIRKPVQELGKIGEFDLVTASLLLHYASTKDELLRMCQTAYNNLRSGERFLAVNNDPRSKGPDPSDAFKKYGYRNVEFPKSLQDGSIIKITLAAGEEQYQFDNYYYSLETYEWALRTAGFETIDWHRLMIPPEIEQEDGRAFWEFFLEKSHIIILECQK
jgi:ubiquinone/menaquinone biosynthesis C-methylase UbiE